MLPKAFTDRAAVNPENMFVAAVASAHMLSWLNVAFGMGIEVASYLDRAHGVLSESAPEQIYHIQREGWEQQRQILDDENPHKEDAKRT